MVKGGKPLVNEGENVIQALIREGRNVSTTWQVVNRPLMSVLQICQHGNIVICGQDGGYVINLNSGETTHFGVEDNVYIIELLLPPAAPTNTGFGRQGR